MTKQELLRKLRNHNFPQRIIQAFQNVDREAFVLPEHRQYAYADMPLPIGEGQTISQPFTIAFMLNLLDIGKSQKILEVGSGSGYVLALINEMAEDAEIYGTELLFQLVEISKSALRTRGNIHIYHTPSSLGLSDKGPFDRILVSAAATRLPPELISQLADNGVIVAPVANSILKAKKTGNDLTQEDYPGFSFVPLITD